MLKVDNFVYGCITINNKDYKSDVYATANGAIAKRKQTLEDSSHLVVSEDEMKFLLKEDPEVIIIGTGKAGTGTQGLLELSKEAEKACKAANVKLEVFETKKASNRFNWHSGKSKVAALFHITD